MGDLGATYDDHLRLVGNRVGDFLLVLIELFSLGRTAEALRAIIGSKSAISLIREPVDPKFQVEPTNHSSAQKTRLSYLSHGIKITTDFSSVLSQCTRLTDRQTDGQTDRILIARPRLHFMQRDKNDFRERLKLSVEQVDVFSSVGSRFQALGLHVGAATEKALSPNYDVYAV